jgi:RNA polymerase sigma-54 factor
MKQSLDLKLGQHLTITPQLQQAIRLLQLSALELQQEIQEALEANPLLEETEDEPTPRDEYEAPVNGDTSELPDDEDGDRAVELTASNDINVDRDAAIDDDSFQEEYAEGENTETNYETLTTRENHNDGNDHLPDIDSRNSAPTTLNGHLLWQMHMTAFSPTDRRIAETVIDAIVATEPGQGSGGGYR